MANEKQTKEQKENIDAAWGRCREEMRALSLNTDLPFDKYVEADSAALKRYLSVERQNTP